MDKFFVKLNQPRVSRDRTAPVVILSLTAYKKISLWTALAAEDYNWEVSGLGTITPRHDGLFVSDVWLVAPEKVGGAHVEQDPAAINQLMMELYAKGRNLRNLRFLWHSHANFGVGWSGTDDKNAKFDFCPDAKWTVNLVTNSKGHFLARQDFPKENHGKTPRETIHDLSVKVLIPLVRKVGKKYKAEYRKKHEKFIAMAEAKTVEIKKSETLVNFEDLDSKVRPKFTPASFDDTFLLENHPKL